MNTRWVEQRQRLIVPLLVLLFVGTLLFVFRQVLLPFIMALVIVFLMEPMVRRMTGHMVRGRRVPRWAAVVLVYLSFFSTVTLLFLLTIPPLTVEMGKAAEEIPDYFNDLREQYLPRWSRQLEETFGLSMGLGDDGRDQVRDAAQEAHGRVGEAVAQAAQVQHIDELPVVDRSGSRPLLLLGEDRAPPRVPTTSTSALGPLSVFLTDAPGLDRTRVAFTLVPDPDNEGFALVFGENDLRIVPLDDGSYVVRFESRRGSERLERFSLERELVRGLTGLVESGSEVAVDLLSLVQTLLAFLINAFVMIILTFMVGAFMSIDLPRIMAFLRSLVPNLWTDAYDELLHRLNRGLSGVIRGQLVICFINGTLTGVGLWILGVDFALMLAIIAGVLSIIPVFGTIISTIPAVLMGLIQGASTAVLVLVWIMIVHFIDANFLTPKIVGSSSELHPVIIIFALLAGENAFGLFGALLAVPVASIVVTLFLFLLSHTRDGHLEANPPDADAQTQPDVPPATG